MSDAHPRGATTGMVAEATPFDALQQMAVGYCLPRRLHMVANLGVADAVGEKL